MTGGTEDIFKRSQLTSDWLKAGVSVCDWLKRDNDLVECRESRNNECDFGRMSEKRGPLEPSLGFG